MSLLSVFLVLIVVGIVVWAINQYAPMDGKFKKILNIVAVIVVVVWLLGAFGIIDAFSDVKVPRFK